MHGGERLTGTGGKHQNAGLPQNLWVERRAGSPRQTHSVPVCSPPSRRVAPLRPRCAGLTAWTPAARTSVRLLSDEDPFPTPGSSPPRGGRRCSSAAAGSCSSVRRSSPASSGAGLRSWCVATCARFAPTCSRRTFNRCGATCRRTGPASFLRPLVHPDDALAARPDEGGCPHGCARTAT